MVEGEAKPLEGRQKKAQQVSLWVSMCDDLYRLPSMLTTITAYFYALQSFLERLQSTWLKLQYDVNCFMDSSSDKKGTTPNGVKQVHAQNYCSGRVCIVPLGKSSVSHQI